ncbi:MAG: HAMP domain-containing sensor histidine kinase [Potamolinea sp.]
MTLSKRFMAWATASNPLFKTYQNSPAKSPFHALSVKLLMSYLGAMVAVMGLSTIAVYKFFAYSLSQELDAQLTMIAQAARHNLPAIQKDRTAVARKLPSEIDQDGDLDLPWQDLHQSQQMVEWFDATGSPLARAGNSLPERPFIPQFQPLQQDRIRSLTIAIPGEQNPSPQGYVRVSIPTQQIEDELHRLLIGLGIGGAIAVFSISTTGWWLTRRSLFPIEKSVEKLQQFTADASHELRSPLTAIKTAVEVMQSHPERVHPSDLKKLMVMAQATQQMSHLIEDLLLLARADNQVRDNGKAHLRVPVHEIIEDLVELFSDRAHAAGIHLQIESLCESWVQGDAAQLRRVCLNLLDNAIKYTSQKGSVHVALTQKGAIAVFSVRDTGVGIAAEHLPRVFDRFWRADQSRSRQVGGTGLGLAIAQAIVAAHHGKITVKSQLGVGSCFQIELPRIK